MELDGPDPVHGTVVAGTRDSVQRRAGPGTPPAGWRRPGWTSSLRIIASWRMRWLTASTCCCISAARSATYPSPRSPAGCVTARRPGCPAAPGPTAARVRLRSWVHPGGLPPPGRPGRGRNLPAGGPRRRGRPALAGHPDPAARPGLGQHHRRRVPGGDQGLPGPPVPAPMGRVRLIIGRLGADPALLEPTPIPDPAGRPADRGAARGVRRGGQYPGRHPHRPPGRARAIGYTRTATARDQLTAAGADASTASMTQFAGAVYTTELRRRRGRSRGPGR